MRHVLSALVQNQPGVLAHISGMLASRGFNIDSLAVGETEDAHLSRMTFVVHGDDNVLEQVRKQLDKIISVVRVGARTWPALVQGTFRHIDSLATGLATDRVPMDDIIVPIVHFTKDNGELSSIAIDENTRVEVVEG